MRFSNFKSCKIILDLYILIEYICLKGGNMSKFKNINLIKKSINNENVFLIIENDGSINSYFNFFMSKLLRNRFSKNTCDSYAIAVATFLDYINEAVQVENEKGNLFDINNLYDYTQLFPKYLSSAQKTNNENLLKIAKRLDFKNSLSHSTEVSYIAAINKYLLYSEEYSRKINEVNGVNNSTELFKSIKRKIDSYEAFNINKDNVFSSVIAGGAKIKNNVILKPSKRGVAQKNIDNDKREFPISHVEKLISLNKDYLTKTIIALLAASGLRLSEALLLTFNDIDFVNRTIKVKNPKLRKLEDFNNYFTYEQQQGLPFKSRATENVFLIHPFDDIFWDCLQKYLVQERLLTESHPFIFNVKNSEIPMIAHDRNLKAFTQKFKYKTRKILPDEYSPHSLRHMYVSYLVNYFPCENGSFGLPIHKVQKIVGHTNLKSTEVYIHTNIELNKLQQIAFFSIQGHIDLEIKKKILLSELNTVERLINEAK